MNRRAVPAALRSPRPFPLDSTVTAGTGTLIPDGFLTALRDPAVVERARCYGDPLELLEVFE